MSDIKNQYGEIVYNLEGNRINDKYGEWKYEIRDNYIYDRYGTRLLEIKGEYLYDTSGSRLGEMKDLAVLLGDTGESDNSGDGGSSGDVTAPSSDVGSSGGSVVSGASGSGTGRSSGCLGGIFKTNSVFRALGLALGGGGIWGCVTLMFSNWSGRICVIIGSIITVYSLITGYNSPGGPIMILLFCMAITAVLGTTCAVMEIIFRASNIGGRIGLILLIVILILAELESYLRGSESGVGNVEKYISFTIAALLIVVIGNIIGWIVKKIIKLVKKQ